jgi:hypothetical protein
MRHVIAVALAALLVSPPTGAPAQSMRMPSTTFLAARLEPQNVVPPRAGAGSGTGVFVFDGAGQQFALRYRLTYATLASPDVRSVLLRNFGAGKEGAIVHRMCGEGAPPCPAGNDATLSGRWTSGDTPLPLTAALITELANRRIYAEVTTAAGKEIRGQLAGNPFMSIPREAAVSLESGDRAQPANGTAAVRVVRLAPGRVSVAVLVTVAGASTDPTAVTLEDPAKRFTVLRLERAADARTGRTLRAFYNVAAKRGETRAATQLFSADNLTLTVFFGDDPRTALHGNVTFVR